jgi:hypothetical protein
MDNLRIRGIAHRMPLELAHNIITGQPGSPNDYPSGVRTPQFKEVVPP